MSKKNNIIAIVTKNQCNIYFFYLILKLKVLIHVQSYFVTSLTCDITIIVL